MKAILILLQGLAMTLAVHALPPHVGPRIETLKGTVTEIVPMGKDSPFSFVRLDVDKGPDDKILLEIYKAIRQRTTFDIRSQRRPKKGEALIVIDRANLGQITPQFRVGDVLTLDGYGVTNPERPRQGQVTYTKITVGK